MSPTPDAAPAGAAVATPTEGDNNSKKKFGSRQRRRNKRSEQQKKKVSNNEAALRAALATSASAPTAAGAGPMKEARKPRKFKPGRIPPEVFLGRRGCFPLAPGLEEYVLSLRAATLREVDRQAALARESDRRDTSTVYAKSIKAVLLSGKDESARMKERAAQVAAAEHAAKVRALELKKGLIMRFTVNVRIIPLFVVAFFVEMKFSVFRSFL
jgi:hypothetical protein